MPQRVARRLPLKYPFRRDKLQNADRLKVANSTVDLFDALKKITQDPAEQLLILAAAFVLLMEATKQNAYDVFVTIKNLMADAHHAERRDHRFAAMKYHLEEDLLPDA